MSNKNKIKLLQIIILFIYIFVSASCSSTIQNKHYSKKASQPKKDILQQFDIKPSYANDRLLLKEKQIVYRYKTTYKKLFDKAHIVTPTIIMQIEQRQLPSGLIFLVMAESNFIVKSKSRKKAIGLWQLMPKTAKHYKLAMNAYVDERMDIYKSSEVALNHLINLHNKFDKWYLAIMAYNGGEARIMEGITRAILDKHCFIKHQCRANNATIQKYRQIIEGYQKKRVSFRKLYKVYKASKKLGYSIELKDLLLVQKNMKRQYMPTESANYLRKIISLAYLDKEYNILNTQNNNPKIQRVTIKGGVSIKSIAKIINEDEHSLQKLNHQIKRGITSPTKNTTSIYIPTDKLETYKKNIKNLPHIKYIIYKVKKGDSLISIAKFYSLPYKLIQDVNNIKTTSLRAGKDILIPLDEDTYIPPTIHIVTSGDSLLYLAHKYHTTIKTLKRYNKLTSSDIFIGDRLIVKFNN